MQINGLGVRVRTTLDILGSDRMCVSAATGAAATGARVGSVKTLCRPTP